jgi:hypothetical protein
MRLPIPNANIVATISIADAPVLQNSLHRDLRPGYTSITPSALHHFPAGSHRHAAGHTLQIIAHDQCAATQTFPTQ